MNNAAENKRSERAPENEIKSVKPVKLMPDIVISEKENYIFTLVLESNWDASKLDGATAETMQLFRQLFIKGMNVLVGKERDIFIEKLLPIVSEPNKNKLWQSNHRRILCAIDALTNSLHRFPTRSELAHEAGLSMQTVDKHLKDYHGSKEQLKKQNEYAILRENVLATVYKYAQSGDVRAARVFLEATDSPPETLKIKNQQNNFIQFNGLTVTQEQLKDLPPGKLNQLQNIFSLLNKPNYKQRKKQSNESAIGRQPHSAA